MLVLLGIGLLAGIVTSISPCVLPVLPILLAGGASGRKPFRIIAGLIGSFVVFTLFASWILTKLGLPQDLLRNVAIALLFVVAATLLVPQLGTLLERPFARLTRHRAGGGGFVLGVSLGLVFVPCAGPVLAAVSVVAANNHVGLRAILVTIAYAVGAAIPMLLIALGGRRVSLACARKVARSGSRPVWSSRSSRSGSPSTSTTTSRPRCPGTRSRSRSTSRTTRPLSGSSRSFEAARSRSSRRATPAATGDPVVNLPDYGPAPALADTGNWFNTKPLTLAGLHGKVVLIDFWTYSCINCLRTLPHLESWYATYHAKGFTIIGVHTPEFAFEHVSSNVGAAVKRLGIRYPVVQDNNYGTWNAYHNQYWPAEFLIDRAGHIRHVHFGESSYGETEGLIRELLGDKGTKAKAVPDVTPQGLFTPESYLGYARLARYAGSPLSKNLVADYTFPKTLPQNDLAYSGAWRVGAEKIVAGPNARLRLHYNARNVYLVLGGEGRVDVLVDGRPAGKVHVGSYRLYTLRSTPRPENALLELRFTPGVQAYAFTFG